MLPRSFNWIIFLYYALAAKLRAEQKFFHTLLLVLYKEDLKFFCASSFSQGDSCIPETSFLILCLGFFLTKETFILGSDQQKLLHICALAHWLLQGGCKNVLYWFLGHSILLLLWFLLYGHKECCFFTAMFYAFFLGRLLDGCVSMSLLPCCCL